MALATMTEKLVDKTTDLFQKGFATFDKMVFLEEGQQDSINASATNFKIMQDVMSMNIEEIEKSISSMKDAKDVREVRNAVEKMNDQNMKDTARRIAAGEDIGIKQMMQFSKDLMAIKKGFDKLDTKVEISFNDLVGEYSKQIVSNANSDKAQDHHFRSLLVAMNTQSEYLKDQIDQMNKQSDLNEQQIQLLAAHKKDLANISGYSERMAKYSKMGPDKLKENKESLDEIVNELTNDNIFQTKMYTTMNLIDDSIQSLSADSEVLNETMNDLSEAQSSGKELIAGSARELKKGAKGMVSSMILSAMGLGGLDEALGLSEKFSQLDLFGKTGLFGKSGLLSNIMKLKGISGVAGGGLAVAGAGAAGYAFGSWLKKKIDEVGGEEDYVGSAAYKLLYGDQEKRAIEQGDIVAKTQQMSKDVEGINAGIDLLDKEIQSITIQSPNEYFLADYQKKNLEAYRRQKEALIRKRRKITGEQEPEVIRAENILDTYTEDFVPYGMRLFDDTDLNKSKTMTEKVDVIPVKAITNEISSKAIETVTQSLRSNEVITPESIKYLPQTMEDTTQMLIDYNKRERENLMKSQKAPAPVIIQPPNPPAPVDLSKSVDDPTLILFSNDVFE